MSLLRGRDASSLLEVLPCHGAAAASGWRRATYRLGRVADALSPAGNARLGSAGDWLLAALALTEAHLTGAVQVSCTRLTIHGPKHTYCAADFRGTCSTWRTTLVDAITASSQWPDASAAPVAWAVLDEAALLDDAAPIASTWKVVAGPGGSSADAQVEVAFRAPLTAEAVDLLAGCVSRAMAALLADVAWDEVDLLDPAERHLQLVDWNPAAPARSPEESVTRRFAQVRDASPEAVAVIDAGVSLTYAELDASAQGLAQRLRNAGVGPGSIVAVAMERSAAAIVAVLGVIQAGAAYLPLDRRHPRERLAFMLADADVQVVVVDELEEPVEFPDAIRRIAVEVAGTLAPPSPAVATVAGTGESLAYVMYTSGSTGTPKGVRIPHRAILRLVCEVEYIELGPGTRMLHAAPLGFDASTLEIWGALLNGGSVVVHDEAVPSGGGLAAAIARSRVTTAWLTASLFNAVVDEDPCQLAGLRQLFTGGEALSVDHVRRMRRAAPATRLCNGYGPTECTTFTCTHAIEGEIPDHIVSIPIGRPIADTRVYILNPRRQPVPVGVLGELYVGGAGVALGYLGRKELTAERFVPDPFGGSDARLYRTGDLVRYRRDGVIEFGGRADGQVKIRGFRIEPGEIEAALSRHPGVRSCAVVPRRARSGEWRLVACYVAADPAPSVPALRAHLCALLPEFMMPARYVRMEAMPVTANGKLDRNALPAPDDGRPELAIPYAPPVNEAERRICAVFGDLLDIVEVGRNDNFFELGGNSLLAMRLIDRLGAQITANGADPDRPGAAPGPLAPTLLFRHPTPAALAAAIGGDNSRGLDTQRMASGTSRDRDGCEPIAIVAMAGRFPGAADVETFWRNLCEGRDSITRFASDQLDPAIGASVRGHPDYVPARGVIDGVEMFDAGFFGIGPAEAELMDPQQRIFLELCWECLERAGHVPDAAPGPVGVFAGMYNASYFRHHVAAHPDLIDKVGEFQVMLDNEKDYIATRVAHKLDLTGPAVSVQTACSTSLVAICQAVSSLRAGQCEMALAGGASVVCPPRSGYLFQDGAMLSPDGHTRTFDARAQGTVFSDGAGVVLLKRLADARADGNPVYAVIRGSAINNDGGRKASFTAPGSDGQAAVIAMALDDAGVDARSIGYVEAHGTATPLGDPIEIEGLSRAFRRSTDDIGFCRIGSVKSNFGHTVIAAGVAGVIKTAMALSERRLPRSLHFETPNPGIDFAGSPFVVNAETCEWDRGGMPRRAGVSSFGVGGTNAHAVLEEAPELPASEPAAGPQLLVLSARTPATLGQACLRLADHLLARPEANLADVAWTLAVGRKAFTHRVAVVAGDASDAAGLLREAGGADAVGSQPARSAEVVFMFPGQGATYAGMGRGLYATEPAYRAAIDECAEILQATEAAFDLRAVLFGNDADALLPTSVMQPATFATEYALARWWMSHGLVPAAMIGHSVGEFTAATLAGVFSLPDALRLVVQRGALMQALPRGGMLSVRMGLDALLARLPQELALAAENAPRACVVAGPLEAIARFRRELDHDGVACRALRTSHAFHSAMMEPVLAPFQALVAAVALSAPQLPLISTATGDWLDAASATSPDYWSRQLREPVRFAGALGQLLDGPERLLLEVGPRATLGTLARQHPQVQERQVAVVASMADSPETETSALRAAVGQLWCRGVAIDPARLDRRQARRRLRLPTYPFARTRFWVDAAPAAAPAIAVPDTPMQPMQSSPSMPPAQPTVAVPTGADVRAAANAGRRSRLLAQVREVFEDVSGFELAEADAHASFIELGLDSLMLTQVALQLQKVLSVKISFRQLMGECASLDRLTDVLDAQLPPDAPMESVNLATITPTVTAPARAATAGADADAVRALIVQQMQLITQHLALLEHGPAALPASPVDTAATPVAMPPEGAARPVVDEEAALAHTRYDVNKAFGAIARIHHAGTEITARQRARLDAFMRRYVARTQRSKDHVQQHRSHLADPRVVNGFRPLLKEITYQIVVGRSLGSRVWDLDGNEYIDALNGFGMNLFGWQPDFVVDAIKRQIELGYEIGPQHPLAGEVARLVCEMTGFARAGLCNTGSEAVLGTIRIARTVTGRSTLVIFTGSYHGIFDEVIVRGTRKLRAVPAAPGILRNVAQNVLVLDYGTEESLAIIRERAHEIAAVLVEPVQSRRPDFQPRQFLRELRTITSDAGALLIFDEVVTGFRADPRGAQAVLGIDADLASYGKVVGGGFPIGVIAGKREYMDSLDGGYWQFGDDSTPTVGVTYFAGTFVRHPLALAAAKAVLEHLKAAGPALQQLLNARTAAMVGELNAFCEEVGAPIEVRHFASVWKTCFIEDHPLQDLLFAMMRSRGIHILDNFPCFLTTAHSEADFAAIVRAFRESVLELQEAEFLPRRHEAEALAFDGTRPPVAGARLGRDGDGKPAWFIPHPDLPDKFIKVSA